MNDTARQVVSEVAQWSRALSAAAQYYWERHSPRYHYLIELLEKENRDRRFERILDVGMSFETILLSRLFPAARVDCMGIGEDARFRPARDFSFYPADLNATHAAVPAPAQKYDLVIFMEVMEHLYTPPDVALRYLASFLRDGGRMVITTPNAAWLKNRLKMAVGKNPFELLQPDPQNMGHIREYTLGELQKIIVDAGLTPVHMERRGLYRFNNAKDNVYSRIADLTHPSLRRTLVAVCEKRPTQP